MKVLILAGGKGTRLWPLSSFHKPKQFQRFFGEKTMLQTTVERVLPLVAIEDIYIGTSQLYKKKVEKQLPKMPLKNIILEPNFRGEVAAFLLFFSFLKEEDLLEPIIILSSDHSIKDKEKFRESLIAGQKFIKKNSDRILLLSEEPTSPDTGLGYIQKGGEIEKIEDFNIFKIKDFKEKPDINKAKEYLEKGDYSWNVGIYIFTPALLIELVKKFVPDSHQRYLNIRKAFLKGDPKKVIEKEFPEMDNVTFSYSILENYKKSAVLPVSMGWSDIGTWAVLKNCLTDLNSKNYIKGNCVNIDSENIFIHGSSDKLIAIIGLKDLVIVNVEDTILICDLKKTQDVKKIVEKLKKNKQSKYL